MNRFTRNEMLAARHDVETGGAGTAIRFAIGECFLGSLLVARNARGICAISTGDSPKAMVRELPNRAGRREYDFLSAHQRATSRRVRAARLTG